MRIVIRGISRQIFGSSNTLNSLQGAAISREQAPRSLNGCDRLLMPKILKDFPDFDVTLAKALIRDHLKEYFSGRQAFTVHNVVICQYLSSGAQKTIVFQAAAGHRENGVLIQSRYHVYYTYLLPQTNGAIAANCPNCGGALGYGVTTCEYCGSRVANPLGCTWEITEIKES